MATLTDYLIRYGDVIGYAVIGACSLIALAVTQWIRRRRDLAKARTAVRLVTYSICEPRQVPVAVTGTYRESQSERWIDCAGKHVSLEGGVDVVRGTSARWRHGTRTYALRSGDAAIAIGVMSHVQGSSWRLVPSAEETGVQLYAMTPRPAPAPLWPWRAPVILAIAAGIVFAGLYETGQVLVDTPGCAEPLRLQIAAAIPIVRDDALAKLATCK